MKLKVGMYIRTDKGRIGRVLTDVYEYKNGYNREIQFKDGVEDTWDMDFEDIIKASHNIIDLIEVGDYVNGEKVGYIDNCEGAMREYYYDCEDASIDVGHWFEEIETIVTKEQFESMSYKVKE